MARLKRIVFSINKWINFEGFHIDYIENGSIRCTNNWDFGDGHPHDGYELPCEFPWSDEQNILIPMWCNEIRACRL